MSRPIPTDGDIPMHGWQPYGDVHRERIRAHAKHDARDGSMERKSWDKPIWLPVVTEEIGEVARVFCENELGNLTNARAELRKELVQVAAMVTAWIDAINAEAPA